MSLPLEGILVVNSTLKINKKYDRYSQNKKVLNAYCLASLKDQYPPPVMCIKGYSKIATLPTSTVWGLAFIAVWMLELQN